MPTSNLKEGASTPQGIPINSFLMKTYLNNTLTESQLDLLGGHLGLVDFLHLISSASPTEQLKLLICYFAGPHGGLETLPAVLRSNLSPELVVKACALTGQFDLIATLDIAQLSLKNILTDLSIAKSLISNESSEPFINYLNRAKDFFTSADLRYFYRLASQNGHLLILTHLEAIPGFDKLEAASVDDYRAYCYA